MILKFSLDTSKIQITFKNIEEYNTNKKHQILIIFDDMVADMLSNKNLKPIVTELFVKGTKRDISFVFITESYFAVPKTLE